MDVAVLFPTQIRADVLTQGMPLPYVIASSEENVDMQNELSDTLCQLVDSFEDVTYDLLSEVLAGVHSVDDLRSLSCYDFLKQCVSITGDYVHESFILNETFWSLINEYDELRDALSDYSNMREMIIVCVTDEDAGAYDLWTCTLFFYEDENDDSTEVQADLQFSYEYVLVMKLIAMIGAREGWGVMTPEAASPNSRLISYHSSVSSPSFNLTGTNVDM